ncbi:hypothetical protein FY557_16800 [Chryseobacterium sp. SN22]|uniref:hypothetical protein n=1 Tax=Chryseobacterium sp. SN22 TaxID=2606431 RepID=UPI0011EC3B36|nr:hypothetical protein [Chryseobacterium sp. SN22]KAA0126561.1 hypothetical protein FY557_16800 [Chryseobacterium sp. SN22]
MKKLFFAFCMMSVCSSQTLTAQSKAPAKSQTTNSTASMMKSLRNKMIQGMVVNGIPKAKTEKFADCFIKDLGEKLTPEELALFSKLNDVKPGQNPPKELIKKAEDMGINEKMQTVGMNCSSLLK